MDKTATSWANPTKKKAKTEVSTIPKTDDIMVATSFFYIPSMVCRQINELKWHSSYSQIYRDFI